MMDLRVAICGLRFAGGGIGDKIVGLGFGYGERRKTAS